MNKTHTGSGRPSSLITIVVIITLFAIAVFMLPKGYNDDLSKIGQGSNIGVLIQNKNSQQSMLLLTLLNHVRGDYEGKVEFLIADIDTQEGQVFERQQQLDRNVLVLFSPNGTRLNIVHSDIDEQGLRVALNRAFKLTH